MATCSKTTGPPRFRRARSFRVARGEAGLKFTPSSGFVGQAAFTVQSSTSANPSGLIGTPGIGVLIVNPVGSGTAIYIVANTNATGPGSLEQAINDSNGDTTQANLIRFAIIGSNQTIDLSTPLSTITQPVTIDGTTQSGYSGTPIVQLVGSAGTTDGLNVTAGGVTIKALVISGFSDAGIILGGTAGGDTVSNCYVGTNLAGTAAQGNGTGIRITSPNNVIGGTEAGSLDLISGNSTGVSVSTAAATGNVIQGDYVGTNATGTKAIREQHGYRRCGRCRDDRGDDRRGSRCDLG